MLCKAIIMNGMKLEITLVGQCQNEDSLLTCVTNYSKHYSATARYTNTHKSQKLLEWFSVGAKPIAAGVIRYETLPGCRGTVCCMFFSFLIFWCELTATIGQMHPKTCTHPKSWYSAWTLAWEGLLWSKVNTVLTVRFLQYVFYLMFNVCPLLSNCWLVCLPI